MAFGSIKGTLTGAFAASITNPFSATGSVSVAVGDLVVFVIQEQGTLSTTAVSDNLGHSYSAVSAGSDSGNVTVRAFYKTVSTAGTLTSVSATTTASTDDVAAIARVYEGPFKTSPLDKAPSDVISDTTSPYTGPATGTLTQADELIVCWFGGNSLTSASDITASSPFSSATAAIIQGNIGLNIGEQVVSATTTQTPAFTSPGDTPAQDVIGVASFMKETADITTIDSASPTIAGQSITTIDVCPVDSATPAIAGQSIIPTDVTPITAATPTIAGSNILELDTIGITSADPTIAGQTISVLEVEPVAVDSASLSISGSSILELDTIGITAGAPTLTGSDIVPTDVTPITKADISISGSNILELDTIGITSASPTIAGQSIISVDVTPITSASLTLAGQDITVSDTSAGVATEELREDGAQELREDGGIELREALDDDSLDIDAGELTLSGSDITSTDALAIAAAALALTGQDIAVTDAGDTPAATQKDGDPDYWRMRGFHVEGGTFADRLRDDTLGALDELFKTNPVRAARPAARAIREYAKASGSLLADDEVEALELVAKQLRSAASQRLADAARRSASEGRALLIAHLRKQRDEEDALIALDLY